MVRRRGTILVLATGGTIAGVGEQGNIAGYRPGRLSADDLLKEIPNVDRLAPIETVQICNVNSDDITANIWLELADIINRESKDDNVKGFVITHGTDTLEETAYFLNLAVKTKKSVIITGAMRPATAISADGPMNLYQAICAAAARETEGQGVLAVFADRIYSARSVTKTSTYQLTAISAGRMGAIGIIRDGKVYMYETTFQKHTDSCEFDVSGLDALPRVDILYFHVDASLDLLKYALKHADGLVIAGAGAGEFSIEFGKTIENAKIPIVVSSRVDDGLITDDMLLFKNTIAANNLSPQKAAVLLRLALTVTNDKDRIAAMFAKY